MIDVLKDSQLIAACVEEIAPGQIASIGVDAWLFRETSPVQEVVIAHCPTFGRVLFLDGVIQLAEMDELTYHEHLVLPSLLFHAAPRRVLILGGGDGLALREVLRDSRVVRAVLVDIDALVIRACATHLADMQAGSLADPRVTVVTDDARNYLRAPDDTFDVVIVDLIDPFSQPELDLYADIIRLIGGVLAPGGLVAVQGAIANAPDFLALRVKAIVEQCFPFVALYRAFVPSYFADYGFILASDQDVLHTTPPQLLDDHARHLATPPQTLVPSSLPGMMAEIPYLNQMKQRIATAPLPKSHSAPVWIHRDSPSV